MHGEIADNKFLRKIPYVDEVQYAYTQNYAMYRHNIQANWTE